MQKITAIIPTFNEEVNIKDAIESVLRRKNKKENHFTLNNAQSFLFLQLSCKFALNF